MPVASKYGANPEYRMLHLWVEQQLGKPNRCDACGTTANRRYHWANISQEYKREVGDWRRLCVPCHKREHHPNSCLKGHALTQDNIYMPPIGGFECLTCKRASRKLQYQRFKADATPANPTPQEEERE